MERCIEHKLAKALSVGWISWLCAWVAVCLLFALQGPARSQSVYDGIGVEGGQDSFAFLVFNSDYNEGISKVVDADENKKGMQKLLSGLAIPEENILVIDNPSKSDLEDAVYEFSRRLSRKSNILIYYNGHSVNFVDAPDNEILLTGFALPRSNDLFLLERRVSRSSVRLKTLIADFIPKRVGQITVFYDACTVHFLPRQKDDNIEHFKIFNSTTCVSPRISGANVFYGGTETGKVSLVNSLNAILSEKPTIDLAALDGALGDYWEKGIESKSENSVKPAFIVGDEDKDIAEICLRKTLNNGKMVCNASPSEVAEAADVVVEKVEEPTEKDNSAVAAAEPEKKKQDQEKRRSERDDWAAAKLAGTCQPYRNFVKNYPKAFFRIKAERAIENLCKGVPEGGSGASEEDINAASAAAEEKQRLMQENWEAAKRAGTCAQFWEFAENHPDSPFAAKATRAATNLCGPKKEVEVVKTEPEPEPKAEPEPVAEETPAVVEEAPAVTAEKPRTMEDDWAAAKRAGTCKLYREFVGNHPDSPFISKATRAATNLCGTTIEVVKAEPEAESEPVAEETPAVTEETPRSMEGDWAAAKRAGTCKLYREFVENHPDSPFISKATRAATNLCGTTIEVAKAESEVAPDPVAEETPAVEEEKPAVVEEKPRSMDDDWAAAKRAGTCKLYREFVENHPDSPFMSKATRAVTNLCGTPKEVEVVKADTKPAEGAAAPETTAENAETPTTEPDEPVVAIKTETPDPAPKKKNAFKDWLAAKKENSCEAYTKYKDNYPKSIFSQKADGGIEKLCSEGEQKEEPKAVTEPESPEKVEIVEDEASKKEEKVAETEDEAVADEVKKPEETFSFVVVDDPETKTTDPDVAEAEPEVTEPDVAEKVEGEAENQEPEPPQQKVNAFTDWIATRKENSCEAFKSFNNTYPNSVFSSKAKEGVVRLCSKQEPKVALNEEPTEEVEPIQEPSEKPVVESDAEQVAVTEPTTTSEVESAGELSIGQQWQATKAANTCEGYLRFLGDHPKSLYGFKARLSVGLKCSSEERVAYDLKVKEEAASQDVAALEEDVGAKEDAPEKVADQEEEIATAETVASEQSDETAKLEETGQPNTEVDPENTEVALLEAPKPEEKVEETQKAEDPSQVPAEVEKPTGPYAWATADATKNSYAFVVVNEEYNSEGFGTVAGAVADKEAILSIISGLKIPQDNVEVLINANKGDIEDAAFEFALKMKPDADLLFYYSGYSITSLENNSNSMLPVDFEVPTNKQVRLSKRRIAENSVRLASMIKDLSQRDPRQVTVIYNACGRQAMPGNKDAPHWVFLKRVPCSNTEIERASIFYPAKTRQVSLANVKESDKDKRSLFMRVFEKTIAKNPSIEVLELQKKLAWSVSSLANRRKVKPREQDPVFVDGYTFDEEKPSNRCFAKVMINGQPTCTGLEGVEYSIQLAKAEVEVPEEVEPPKADAALEGWLEAKKLNTCEGYKAFDDSFSSTEYDHKVADEIEKSCAALEEEIEEPLVITVGCEATGDVENPMKLTRGGFKFMQEELNRMGCNVGTPDGLWGRNSQSGYDKFTGLVKFEGGISGPSCEALDQMRAMPTKRVCPLICGKNFKKVGEECVRVEPVKKPTPVAKTTPKTNPTTSTSEAEAALAARLLERQRKKEAAARAATKQPTQKATTPITSTKCAGGKVFKNGRCVINPGLLGAFR